MYLRFYTYIYTHIYMYICQVKPQLGHSQKTQDTTQPRSRKEKRAFIYILITSQKDTTNN